MKKLSFHATLILSSWVESSDSRSVTQFLDTTHDEPTSELIRYPDPSLSNTKSFQEGSNILENEEKSTLDMKFKIRIAQISKSILWRILKVFFSLWCLGWLFFSKQLHWFRSANKKGEKKACGQITINGTPPKKGVESPRLILQRNIRKSMAESSRQKELKIKIQVNFFFTSGWRVLTPQIQRISFNDGSVATYILLNMQNGTNASISFRCILEIK